MMILEANHIEKMIGDRLLFSVPQLRIHRHDRIGIVGKNGVGKTMLLNILAGYEEPDKGEITCDAYIEVISQLKQQHTHKSGGEITQEYVNTAFSKAPDILFADEPTTNLDIERVEQLEQKCKHFKGAIVVISHDREFLNKVCKKIWEIEHQTITVYKGNYSDYSTQKELEKRQQAEKYEEYREKKKQLEKAIQLKKQKANKMIKPPAKRMGFSESKLWKMQKGTKQKEMHQSIKALETRIDKLEKVEKPKELPGVKMDLPDEYVVKNKVVIRTDKIFAKMGDRTLWSDVSFRIKGGEKIAVIGPNGSGKTTLLKQILQQQEDIYIGSGVKPGYFSQNLDILEPDKTILESVKETSAHPDELIRTVLARLLFSGDDVFKKVHVLSGGEKVKVAFAKVFLSDMNVLVMDEPTNFLDIHAIEALEYLLTTYEGTVLFVSHDRQFVEKVANKILEIKNQTVLSFDGTYEEYRESRQQSNHNFAEEELLIVETKLTETISRLSEHPSDKLEQEFQMLVSKRNALRNQLKL